MPLASMNMGAICCMPISGGAAFIAAIASSRPLSRTVAWPAGTAIGPAVIAALGLEIVDAGKDGAGQQPDLHAALGQQRLQRLLLDLGFSEGCWVRSMLSRPPWRPPQDRSRDVEVDGEIPGHKARGPGRHNFIGHLNPVKVKFSRRYPSSTSPLAITCTSAWPWRSGPSWC